MQRTLSQQRFIISLMGLCFLYLGFELFFNAYAMLSVDEFWFAHRIYQYKDGLPYRDFAPYKTVLGYYLLLVPMLFSHGILNTLIFTKNVIAIINTCILLGSAFWLTRFFSRPAILVSLALLISSEIFLSYSTNIRVDLLGYWFCFFSLLFLLEKRFILAGLLIGLGFCASQKAIWYLFASNVALSVCCVCWLVTARNIKTVFIDILDILQLNLTALFVIAIYTAFWSWIADWNTVINSIFYEASAMYHLDWYDHARKLFWSAITLYNPLLFLLWPLTLISILVTYKGDNNYHRRVFIITYAFAILFCLIPYKQVFPYYMQITYPVFFILYAAFFTWLFGIFSIRAKNLNPQSVLKIATKNVLLIFLLAYTTAILFFIAQFGLPKAYLLICVIPILLCAYITKRSRISQQITSLIFNLIAITILFIGAIYPFPLFVTKLIAADGAYQKANIQVINALLQDESVYVAGIELIYNKTQPIAGLRHLMGPAIDYLYSPSEKLRPVMLASLYEDPNATAGSVLEKLKASSVKFYVNNYRMMALPDNIKNYLVSEYEHYWGSIYTYAPQIHVGKSEVMVKFSGKYLIESKLPGDIKLDGKSYHTHASVYLKRGTYSSNANRPYRLKLIPEQPNLSLDPNFRRDEWEKVIF